MQYVESPLNPLYLQGRETVDKSIQETLNLTLKVVDNLLKTPSYAQVSACYPQGAGMTDRKLAGQPIFPAGQPPLVRLT